MAKLTESLVLARSRTSDLYNVRKFNCWASDLIDVSLLRRMANVQVISLSVNKITSLEDFGYCTNLEELYIRKNMIGDLSQICYLRHLPKLRILWLSDNPCAQSDNYRMTVLKTLPNLQKLDNIPVREDEVNDAIEQGQELVLPGCGDHGDIVRISIANDDSLKEDIVQTSDTIPEHKIEQDDQEKEKENGQSEQQREEKENGQSEQQREEKNHSEERMKEEENEQEEPKKEKQDELDDTEREKEKPKQSPVSLSLDETNRIRVQLGLKPLVLDKVASSKPRLPHGTKSRNANLLQATLHLIKELDSESLEVVADAIQSRLQSL